MPLTKVQAQESYLTLNTYVEDQILIELRDRDLTLSHLELFPVLNDFAIVIHLLWDNIRASVV